MHLPFVRIGSNVTAKPATVAWIAASNWSDVTSRGRTERICKAAARFLTRGPIWPLSRTVGVEENTSIRSLVVLPCNGSEVFRGDYDRIRIIVQRTIDES